MLESQADYRYNIDTLIGLTSGERRIYEYEVKPYNGVILPFIAR